MRCALHDLRVIPTSVARWVSETKTPQCGVFVSGVAQSASFEARLCLAHKTTHDGDWALFAQTFLTTMRRWRAMKNPTDRNQKRFHSRYNFGYGILLYIRKMPCFCPLTAILGGFEGIFSYKTDKSAILCCVTAKVADFVSFKGSIVQGINLQKNIVCCRKM